MLAQDLNITVLGLLGGAALGALIVTFRRALSFEDTTVEAVDLAPEAIDPTELRTLLDHGDRANAILHDLRTLAIERFEADPSVDAIAPDKVFHLSTTEDTKAQFEAFATEFEGFLRLTRKYKLALDQRTQRSVQKIYFAWDPGGNAMQVNTGDRLWKKDVRPAVEKLLGESG